MELFVPLFCTKRLFVSTNDKTVLLYLYKTIESVEIIVKRSIYRIKNSSRNFTQLLSKVGIYRQAGDYLIVL